MASRSRTTFKKRQKELSRQEKQRDKAAKRMQRKVEKRAAEAVNEPPTSDNAAMEVSSPPSSGPGRERTPAT